MAIKDTVLGPVDWLRVRLGLKPRCSWVQDRFGEYRTWELEPAELRAVEFHLVACPECAREWRKTEQILDQLEAESPIVDRLNEFSSEDFMAGMLARLDEYEFERANRARKRWTPLRGIKDLTRLLNTMPRFAAAFLLLVSVSALAYIAPELAQIISGSADQAESVPSQKCSQIDTPAVVIQSSSNAPVGHFADQYTRANLPVTFKLPQQFAVPDLSSQLDALTAEAQVEMLLPHTEAEWEAWARKEYPHIMWVYDVLTLPEYGYNWDGKPVNIPEWAKKIWTDEATKPTGWRALVFYSGEIIKFDYPQCTADPNVRPTFGAMKLASAIAGYSLRLDITGNLELPKLRYGDLGDKYRQSQLAALVLLVPDKRNTFERAKEVRPEAKKYAVSIFEYADQTMCKKSIFSRTLIYIATSSHCVPDESWAYLEFKSKNLLYILREPTHRECDFVALERMSHLYFELLYNFSGKRLYK